MKPYRCPECARRFKSRGARVEHQEAKAHFTGDLSRTLAGRRSDELDARSHQGRRVIALTFARFIVQAKKTTGALLAAFGRSAGAHFADGGGMSALTTERP